MAESKSTGIKAAWDCWEYLESLDEGQRLDIVHDADAVAHETPCSAVLAAYVCEALGLKKGEFGIFFAGHSTPEVNQLYHVAGQYEESQRFKVALQWCNKFPAEKVAHYGEPELESASA